MFLFTSEITENELISASTGNVFFILSKKIFLSQNVESGFNVTTTGLSLRVQLIQRWVFSQPRNFLNVLWHENNESSRALCYIRSIFLQNHQMWQQSNALKDVFDMFDVFFSQSLAENFSENICLFWARQYGKCWPKPIVSGGFLIDIYRTYIALISFHLSVGKKLRLEKEKRNFTLLRKFSMNCEALSV